MIETKKYKCELCGTEYSSWSKCRTCENIHSEPISIKQSIYEPMAKYPKKIYLKMSNGAECSYVLNSCVE